MLQLLWNMFRETGQINSYMLYKALENSNRNSDCVNAWSGSDKDDVPGPFNANHGKTKYTF